MSSDRISISLRSKDKKDFLRIMEKMQTDTYTRAVMKAMRFYESNSPYLRMKGEDSRDK